MEGLGINLGYLFVQIFNFAILLLVLRAWVYHPLVDMLEKRRQAIEKGLEDARVAADARANAEKEAQKILTNAQAEASKIVREATERAEVVAKEIKGAAETESVKERESLVFEVEQERNRLLGDLRGQVASLAIAAAQKIIGQTMDEARQRGLIAEFFSGVRAGRVVVLEDVEKLRGEAAVITSALPLTPEEQTTIKRDILAKVGAETTVTFRVDPGILGGLVINIGDKLLDNSVAGQLAELRRTLH
ncbi:MAG: F0F1 ATP synthase subunit B [Chloroflexota bacterium]